MLQMDLLRVHVHDERVIVLKWHSWRKRYGQLSPTQHPLSGRWRYNIRGKGKAQRTIYRNKLVWMSQNLTMVAEGKELHHLDQDNQHDASENLEPMDAVENARLNFDKGFKECAEFFDALAAVL